MRTSEVVELLQKELPKRTNLFSESVSITSLTRSGATVTAVTGSPHGASSGDYALIRNAKELNPIVSLTFADGIAVAETQNRHDLTEPTVNMIRFGNIHDFNFADVSGADQSEYNSRILVNSVPNRKNFTYPVTGSPASPATGSPVMLQEGGYNGRFEITVIDPITFTYQISGTPISPAGGIVIAEFKPRITAEASLENALRAYTKQAVNKYYLFAILGDVVISKDRSILTDASSENSNQNEIRDRLIEPLKLFVFVPRTTSYSARPYRDEMEDMRGFIYHSMAGHIFGSALIESPWCKISPTGDRFVSEASTDAIYIHEFSFQRVVDVTYGDTVGPPDTVAFRDVSLESTFDFGTGEMTTDVDLDEQPL